MERNFGQYQAYVLQYSTKSVQIHMHTSFVDGLSEAFDEIKNLLSTINNKTCTQIEDFRSFKDQIVDDIRSLKDDITSLNDSMRSLSAQLQTSLTSTNFKLDVLNATTAQLSTDHQQIIEKVLQLQQNLCNDPTCTPENIQRNASEVMGPYTCGDIKGWRRVVYLNMTDPSTVCPSGWQLSGHSKRSCGKVNPAPLSCDSVTFPVSGGEYSRVCGRITAYQYQVTDAFEAYNDGMLSIDDAYVAGVSVTHGHPPQHIWTFAAGSSEAHRTWDDACPCDADIPIHVPPFVGSDYFCESGVNAASTIPYGFHPDDPLWDGENCTSNSTCCSLNTPPYFVKQLPTFTNDDIEARLCQYGRGEDSPIELIELYVQ